MDDGASAGVQFRPGEPDVLPRLRSVLDPAPAVQAYQRAWCEFFWAQSSEYSCQAHLVMRVPSSLSCKVPGMTERFSPTIRRRQLGRRLQRLRQETPDRPTAEQVGKQVKMSQSKISKIEAGHLPLSPTDLDTLLAFYDAPPNVREELHELRRKANEPSWWQSFPGVAAPGDFIDFEGAATRIRSWDPLLVPGLLQIEDVTREVVRAGLPSLSLQQVERVVAVRTKRSHVLLGDDRPEVQLIIGEAALRTVIKSPATMAAQLAHVLDVADRHGLMIQVMPFAAGAHAGMESGFVLLDFPDPDPAMGYTEYGDGALFVGKAHDVAAMNTRYAHLTATAMRPDASREYVRRVQLEYEEASP